MPSHIIRSLEDSLGSYRERASSIAGAVAWTRTADGMPGRVLPDGCMDLMWIGDHLVVAGPDTTSFTSCQPAGTVLAGLRFASGVAPAVLGVPAHALPRRAGAPRRRVGRGRGPPPGGDRRGRTGAVPGARGHRPHARPCSRRRRSADRRRGPRAPGPGSASRRSPARSVCPTASCSAARSMRSATGPSCWRGSCASATPSSWPAGGWRWRPSRRTAATPTRRTWPTTSSR